MRPLLTTGVWLAGHAGIFCVALSLLLPSCVSYGTRLAGLNNQGQYRQVTEQGGTWLEHHADQRNTPDWAAVYREYARASLALAHELDTAPAYMQFGVRFADSPLVAGLVQQAHEWRAAAELRDVIVPAHEVGQLRAFRVRFAGTAAAGRAWLLEAGLALERAGTTSTPGAFREFRATYSATPGAEDLLAHALRRQAQLDFDLVVADPSIEGFQDFRESYTSVSPLEDLLSRARSSEAQLAFAGAVDSDTPADYRTFVDAYGAWSEASALSTEARTREAAAALSIAIEEHSVEALVRFRGAYPQDPWPARAESAISALLIGPLRLELEGAAHVSHPDVDVLLAAFDEHRTLILGARPAESGVFQVARARNSAALWRFVVALYPESAQIGEAMTRLRETLWAEASSLGSAERWQLFVRIFPEDDGAEAAEQFLRVRREFARAERRRYTVAVGRSRQENGEVEVSFTVRDCADHAVVGLSASSFRVFEEGERRTVTSFLGMEDARPLTVEMALDLSGSMATEQEAVRQSMLRFVDTLKFRGRDSRIGLIGYSDLVMAAEAPSSDPRDFIHWMGRLPSGVGGTAEDGVGALARALDVLDGERAERVVVMLSDEPLQANAGGRNALHLERECAHVMGVSNCIAACRSPRCRLACWDRRGARERAAARRCATRFTVQQCINWLAPDLQNAINQCSDAAGLVSPLSERLSVRAIRPFFVVSDSGGGRDPFGAYRSLATSLGGEVLVVPNDATSPEPYSAALLRVADILSSQYVVRYQSIPGAQASAPRILVRPQYGWVRSSLAPPEAMSVQYVGGRVDCPSLIGVRRDGMVIRSARCGSAWLDAGVRAADDGVVVSSDSRAAVLGRDGSLSVFSEAGTVHIAPRGGGGALSKAVFDATGRLWSIDRGADVDHVMAFDRAGQAIVDWSLPSRASTFTMVPTSQDATSCVLSVDGLRRCRAIRADAWESRTTTGLPLSTVASVLSIDAGYPVLLAATSDGSVYRSADRGRAFVEVLATHQQSAARFALSPAGDLVCAGIASKVWCSEDDGLSWFEVGSETADTGTAAPVFVGDQLFAVRAGRVDAAHVVVTRELPGAAALFDTSSDRPRPGADLLLQETARTLASDRQLLLRIEGHADSRGNAADNEALAGRRAERVAQVLMGHGVARERVEVTSFGERRPIRTGTSAADLARNRRVEIIVLSPMPVGGWYGNRCAH